MPSKSYTPVPHSKVRYKPRAHYDRETVHGILDVGLVAHVGMIFGDKPMVIPMAYARLGETIYIHGAKATRLIKKPSDRAPVCLTVTHIDGLVVARSAFHHSVNYRSVVVHGSLRRVETIEEKERALIAVTNHLLPGRWDEVRPMSAKELKATGVLAIEIETASAKVRTGPPVDDEPDYPLPIWAGVLPVRQVMGTPIDDDRLNEGLSPEMSVALARAKFKVG